MLPPRVRITVRTLMVAVALVGLILFGSITAMRMSRRAKGYRSRALMWRFEEGAQRKHLALCRKEVDGMIRAASRLARDVKTWTSRRS